MAEPKTFTLAEPIVAHEGEVREITFRSPKSKEVFDFGHPFQNLIHTKRDPKTGVEEETEENKIDRVALRQWMIRLSGKDAEIIDQIELSDFQEITTWLAQKFRTDSKNSKPPSKP
jgi:hypothetical protein